MASSSSSYQYHTLLEAAELPRLDPNRKSWEINVYAFVMDCDVARKTKGTDFVCNIKLGDSSVLSRNASWDWTAHPPQQGVELLLFARRAELLPTADSLFHIVRLHRVAVGKFNDKPQLVGNISMKCAMYLYAPAPAAGPKPCKSSSNTLADGPEHEQHLARLRQLVGKLAAQPVQKVEHHLRKIEELRPPADSSSLLVDMCVQVVALDQRSAQAAVMWIWDGTDAMPVPSSLEVRASHPRSDSSARSSDDLPLLRRQLPLQRQEGVQLGDVPLLGTCVPVIIPTKYRPVEMPPINCKAKLKVAAVQYASGQLQLVFIHSSRLSFTHQSWAAQLDARLKERLEQGLVSSWAPAGAAQLGSSTDEDQAWRSIRQVQQCALVEPPGRYRVLARLVSHEGQLEQACRRGADLQLEQQEWGPGGWVYALKLVLADATGEVEVVAFAKAAELLFGPELPPCDLCLNREAACRLREVLQRLELVELGAAGAGAGGAAASCGGDAAAGVGVGGAAAVLGQAADEGRAAAAASGQEPVVAAAAGVPGAEQQQGACMAVPAARCTWLDCCLRRVVHGEVSLYRLESTILRQPVL